MSFVSDAICASRNILLQGFRSLPIILGGATLFLGLTQGNFNFLFFFVGLCILVPTATLLVNGLWDFLFGSVSILPEFLKIQDSLWFLPQGAAEQCSLLHSGLPAMGAPAGINVVPSFWMSMMSFVYVYLFVNALNLYNKQAEPSANPARVSARKSQAIMSMILVVGLFITTMVLRYGTACETALGVGISALLGGGLAYGWYSFMRACGMGRLDDLFGIQNRILPMQSQEDVNPTVCVPTATATTS